MGCVPIYYHLLLKKTVQCGCQQDRTGGNDFHPFNLTIPWELLCYLHISLGIIFCIKGNNAFQ
jgi:hypothetical protein